MAKAKAGRKKTVVWHPLVHQRFDEDLYFFLLSAKPFVRQEITESVKKLALNFGVKEFCAYRIFGQYDVLLRIWLPSIQGPQFLNKAAETVTNLQAIIPFHVTNIVDKWRFKNNDYALAIKRLSTITPNLIKEVQEDKAPHDKQDLIAAGLLAEVSDYRKGNNRAIKAFIAISEPKWSDLKKRQGMFSEIISLAEQEKRFQKITIHSGMGFSWLLIKVVTEEFYSLGHLVETIADKYGNDGISTNTFIASTDTYVEGECISTAALEARDGDEMVRLFIPELYSASDISSQTRDEMEKFISSAILSANLPPTDRLVFQRYFKAVINDNAIEAFTALYPKFVETEQILREKAIEHAGRRDGVQKLLQELDPNKEFIKGAGTMPLAYSLRGCQRLLMKAHPYDTWLPKMTEKTFDEIAMFRNKIMHGTGFRRDHDWKHFAQSVIDLLRIRERFVKLFETACLDTEQKR